MMNTREQSRRIAELAPANRVFEIDTMELPSDHAHEFLPISLWQRGSKVMGTLRRVGVNVTFCENVEVKKHLAEEGYFAGTSLAEVINEVSRKYISCYSIQETTPKT